MAASNEYAMRVAASIDDLLKQLGMHTTLRSTDDWIPAHPTRAVALPPEPEPEPETRRLRKIRIPDAPRSDGP